MKNFLILCGLLLSTGVFAQPFERLLSPGGDTWSTSEYVVSVSLGEPLIGTLRADEYLLTQGFLQVYDLTTGTTNPGQTAHRLELFPNPSDGFVNLRHTLSQDRPYRIHIYNLLGNVVYQTRATGATTLDLTHLSNGLFILQMEQDQKTYSIKFEKH